MKLRVAARLAVLSVGLAAGTATAGTLRLAIVVGSNAGSGAREPLRYADDDAAKVARVLTELGGVAPQDLVLLEEASGAEVARAFDRMKVRVAQAQRLPDQRVLLLFYFSGHSDGVALELGTDRLGFGELRRRLMDTGASLRLAIVDSCQSGALLTAKSGHRGEAFQIRLSDDLPTAGTVLLTSSAADEDALESSELGGSFFTHNFVSGLRGAADASGDGRVTLAEAYAYAYAHTVAETSETAGGSQHPAYDIRLSGLGELVLTELTHRSAGAILPADAERVLLVDAAHGEVIAESPAGAPRHLAVPPGTYQLRAWRGGRVWHGQIAVRAGETREVSWSDLQAGDAAGATAKGGEPPAATLARAVALFEDLADEQATPLLRSLLGRGPPSVIAARAHIFLALIAMNAGQPDTAKSEMKLALEADPAVDLPRRASPKARLAFAEAAAALHRELQISEAPALLLEPAPTTAAQTAIEAPAPVPKRSAHVLSWALIGTSALAGAVAVYGGLQVVGYQNMVTSQSASYDAAQWSSARSSALFWRNAWLPIAIGGALAAGGAALAW